LDQKHVMAATAPMAQAQAMIPTSADGVSVDAVHAMVPGMPEAPAMPVDAVKAALISGTMADDAPKSGCFSCFGGGASTMMKVPDVPSAMDPTALATAAGLPVGSLEDAKAQATAAAAQAQTQAADAQAKATSLAADAQAKATALAADAQAKATALAADAQAKATAQATDAQAKATAQATDAQAKATAQATDAQAKATTQANDAQAQATPDVTSAEA